MTQVAGTTDTFDSAVLKESLDSVIWDLFPTDTIFQNNIDKVSVGNTQHQWVFDTLAAATNNKQIQGDDASYGTLATAIRVSNYTQIARKTILMSGTLTEGVDVVGQNPMGRAVMKAMKEYKRDVEFDLLGRQGSSAGATNTAAASGGVGAWIWGQSVAVVGLEGNAVMPTLSTTGTTPCYASAAVAGMTDGTTGTVTIALSDITTAAELAWNDGGEPETIITGAYNKKQIDTFTSQATRTADVGATDMLTIQGSANLIVTSFGTFKVLMSRYIHRTTTYLLQMDKWAMGQLRPPKVKDLAPTGDASRKMIIGEYTLIARNPNSSAKIFSYPGA